MSEATRKAREVADLEREIADLHDAARGARADGDQRLAERFTRSAMALRFRLDKLING